MKKLLRILLVLTLCMLAVAGSVAAYAEDPLNSTIANQALETENYHLYLDYLNGSDGFATIKGWGFNKTTKEPVKVQIQLYKRNASNQYMICDEIALTAVPRTDVANTYGLNNTYVGFDRTFPLSAGTYAVCLTYGDESATQYTAWDIDFLSEVVISNPSATLDHNDGTGAADQIAVDYGSAMPTITPPTRTGYTFAGYYDSNDVEYILSSGESARNWDVCGSGDLSADWVAHSYTVAFDANGGTGTIENQAFTYDVAQALTSNNTITRDSYAFCGWNTKADGTGTAIADGATVSNLTATDGETVTLYAQWNYIHSVTFDGNGHGEGTVPDVIYVVAGDGFDAPVAPYEAGYAFGGWYETADCSGEPYNCKDTPVTEDLTLYAKWTQTHTITFYPNGGTLETTTITDATALPNPLPIPTKDGVAFEGWYTDEALTTAAVAGSPISADTNLYAKWTTAGKIGDTTYATMEEFVSAYANINDAETATLTAEFDLGSGTLTNNHLGANIILDLNGHTITSSGSATIEKTYGTLAVSNGTIVNTNPSGEAVSLNGSSSGFSLTSVTVRPACYGIRVYNDVSMLTVDGCAVYGPNVETGANGTFAIQIAGANSHVTVKNTTVSGLYALDGDSSAPASFAVESGSYTGSLSNVSISGGSFSVDPSAFVKDGYMAKQNADFTWTVIPETFVAQIGDVKYYTLEDAVEDVEDDGVITLLADCDAEDPAIVTEEKVFDIKGVTTYAYTVPQPGTGFDMSVSPLGDIDTYCCYSTAPTIVDIIVKASDTPIYVGGDKKYPSTKQVKAEVIMSDGSTYDGDDISWMSSNDYIATVVPVSGTKGQVATVTAVDGSDEPIEIIASVGDFADYVEVDVLDYVPVIAMSIDPQNFTLNTIGSTRTLSLTLYTEYGEVPTNQTVLWESNHPEYASVNENGVVTAHANGQATIKATWTGNNNITATSTVTVNCSGYGTQYSIYFNSRAWYYNSNPLTDFYVYTTHPNDNAIVKAYVDNVLVASSNYTYAATGQSNYPTYLRFNVSYMKTLAYGTHTLVLRFGDESYATANFCVRSIYDAPLTGDSSNLTVWAWIAGLSLTGAAAVGVGMLRKKKESK